jgi:hypothetical protein
MGDEAIGHRRPNRFSGALNALWVSGRSFSPYGARLGIPSLFIRLSTATPASASVIRGVRQPSADAGTEDLLVAEHGGLGVAAPVVAQRPFFRPSVLGCSKLDRPGSRGARRLPQGGDPLGAPLPHAGSQVCACLASARARSSQTVGLGRRPQRWWMAAPATSSSVNGGLGVYNLLERKVSDIATTTMFPAYPASPPTGLPRPLPTRPSRARRGSELVKKSSRAAREQGARSAATRHIE